MVDPISSAVPASRSQLRAVPPPLQPILPGSRAIKDNAPFVRRVANVKIGDADAKLIMMVAASFCDVWVDGSGGRTIAGRETLRLMTELSERRWRRGWSRCLDTGGLTVGRRRGIGRTRTLTVHAVPLQSRSPVIVTSHDHRGSRQAVQDVSTEQDPATKGSAPPGNVQGARAKRDPPGTGRSRACDGRCSGTCSRCRPGPAAIDLMKEGGA